jgi:hypothetical protein
VGKRAEKGSAHTENDKHFLPSERGQTVKGKIVPVLN